MDFRWFIGTLSGKKELILTDSQIVNELATVLTQTVRSFSVPSMATRLRLSAVDRNGLSLIAGVERNGRR